MARPKIYSDHHELWFKLGLGFPTPELLEEHAAAFDAALKFCEEQLGKKLSEEDFDAVMDWDYGKWLKEERPIK